MKNVLVLIGGIWYENDIACEVELMIKNTEKMLNSDDIKEYKNIYIAPRLCIINENQDTITKDINNRIEKILKECNHEICILTKESYCGDKTYVENIEDANNIKFDIVYNIRNGSFEKIR